MDTEQMELLMRRLRSQHHDIKQGAHYTPTEDPSWDATNDAAEALLAEHDARVAAERKAGDERAEAWKFAARAEQAERERDEAVESWGSARADLAHAQARCASLEAALRDALACKRDCCGREMPCPVDRARPVLGEQEAPPPEPQGKEWERPDFVAPEVIHEQMRAASTPQGEAEPPFQTVITEKGRRHQEHYRSCGCLDDSAECCDPTCCPQGEGNTDE